MKKLLCLILALVMVLGLATTAFAGGSTPTTELTCDVNDHDSPLVYHAAEAATCTAGGKIAFWKCTECDRCYYDDEGTPKLEDGKVVHIPGPEDLTTDATGHTYVPVWDWASVAVDGEGNVAGKPTLSLECAECGASISVPANNIELVVGTKTEPTCNAAGKVPCEAKAIYNDATAQYSGSETKDIEFGSATGSHKVSKIKQVDPTTTKTGTKEHWKCSVCKKLFKTAAATDEATAEWLEIPKLTADPVPTHKTYTVKFDTNGGYLYYDSVYEYVGYTIDLDDYVPTKFGYTFCGWYNYSLTTRYRVVSSVTAPSTVYAKWVKNGDWYCPFHAYGKCPTTCAYYEYNCSGTTCYWTLRDISTSDWYYNHVCYVVDKGILKPAGLWFEPDVKLTRAELATAIYAIAGKPAVTPTGKFRDVSKYDSCACAVEWGETYGILQGIGNKTFAPEDNVTREQMAAIFYRFANYLEKYGTKGTLRTSGFYWGAFKELTFKDAKSVSTWAKDAVRWSVDNCLFTGDNWNRFNPKGNITRAEAAAVLSRFCK